MALVCLLLCGGISFIWSSFIVHSSPGRMGDFKAVYYGARCLIEHRDPYKETEFLRVYQADGGGFPSDPAMSHSFRRAIPVCINLPTSLLLIAPMALLSWEHAYKLWMILEAGCLIFAGFLAWNLAGEHAPGLSLTLICILLANSELLFSCGNLAGIAVGLCVIAIWCFMEERFVLAGAVCLAVSLAMKPHDAGFIWLYLMLAGATLRKRALQTLVVTVLLCLPAVLWVSHVAPHWIPELHSNLLSTSLRGDLNDPGPESLSGHTAASIIDLQSVISVFRDDPRIYNPVSYLVCGALLFTGLLTTLRSRCSKQNTWLALATIVPISMLATYHRPYDAKLLLLTVPAAGMLWAEGGPIAWTALAMNTSAILLTGDIPLAALAIVTRPLHKVPSDLPATIRTVLLTRPSSLALFAMAVFYLWVYVQRAPHEKRYHPSEVAAA